MNSWLDRRGARDQAAWLQAVAHWGDRLPLLRQAVLVSASRIRISQNLCCVLLYGTLPLAFLAQVAFMAATFASTSEIEQQFSILQMLSCGRKSSTTIAHLRDLMKVRLNGSKSLLVAS